MFVMYHDTHNQAGIAHSRGIAPLLKLLESRNGTLQYNAAFALYGLADNEDNVADLIRFGGVQKLLDGEFRVQYAANSGICSKAIEDIGGEDSWKGIDTFVVPNAEF